MLTFRKLNQFHTFVWSKVKNGNRDLIEVLQARTDIPLADYLTWLQLRGTLDDPGAPAALRLREFLATWKHITAFTFEPSTQPGYVRTRNPTTDGVAHAWMYQNPEFFEICEQRLATTEPVDWDRVRDELSLMHRDRSMETHGRFIAEQGGSAEDGVRIYGVTIICEAALLAMPSLTEPALSTYQEVVGSAACAALPKPVWETHVYHYLYALVRGWARVSEPRAMLESAVKLGEFMLRTADLARAPRLIRDTHWVCARLYERLGEWDRENFQRAIEHYQNGLGIEALKAERDPRARALADLANTLHRSGTGSIAEIEKLYKESLALRPVDEASMSSVSGRLNYAIFLFERVGTTLAKSRALELIAEAEDAYPNIDEETRKTPWCRDLLASLWMTKANIWREDATKEGIRESLDLYDKATLLLGEDPRFRPTRALLALNRCFSHLDLHDLDGDNVHLLAADMASREASALAINEASSVEARLCDSIIALRLGEPISSVLRTIDECARAARGAGGVVRSLSALAWRARVGLASGTEIEIEESRRLFRDGFETALHAGLYFEFLAHARGFADACIRKWRLSDDISLLHEAIEALDRVSSTIQKQLEIDLLLIDPDNAYAHLAAVAAELTWLRVTTGSSVEAILTEVTIAKGPDIKIDLMLKAAASTLSATTATELSALRRDDWRIRRSVIQRDRLDAQVVADVEELRTAERRRAITLGRHRSDLLAQSVELQQVCPESGVVVDITVCRWGSVIILLEPHKTPTVSTAPFSLTLFQELQDRWSAKYAIEKLAPHDITEEIVTIMQTELLFSVCERSNIERLVWVPHVLAGLPLHGVRTRVGGRLIETAKRVGFASNVIAVPKRPVVPNWPGRNVLCMALDPGGSGELVNACREVAVATAYLLDAGANVMVVAHSGGKQGIEAFAHRSVVLDARATCESPAALGAWLSANVGSFDHVLIASHGVYGGEGGTLVLPSETVSILDLLATSELKPGATIHLSACETAMRVGVVYSLAGGLLHLGASFVLGTCWKVRDKDALRFSTTFYRMLTTDATDFEGAAVDAMLELRRDVGDEKIGYWSPFLAIIG